jgi:hypothetical protein
MWASLTSSQKVRDVVIALSLSLSLFLLLLLLFTGLELYGSFSLSLFSRRGLFEELANCVP